MMGLRTNIGNAQYSVHSELALDRKEIVLVLGIRVVRIRSRRTGDRLEDREVHVRVGVLDGGIQRRKVQGKGIPRKRSVGSGNKGCREPGRAGASVAKAVRRLRQVECKRQ